MNKKQLIVLWATGIIVILAILLVPQQFIGSGRSGRYVVNWRLIAAYAIPALIAGGMLIYTLRKDSSTNMNIDKKIVNKIIAREGLVIIAIYLVSIAFSIIQYLRGISLSDAQIFIYIPLFFYILYLLVRFIIWATRTLRAK